MTKRTPLKIDWNKLTSISTILSVLIAMIALYYSYKAITSNFEIANLSGNFNKPNIELYLGGYKLQKNDAKIPIIVIFGTTKEIDDTTMIFAHLPVKIENTGKKSSENLRLFFTMPKNLLITDEFVKIHDPVYNHTKRESIPCDDKGCINYDINQLDPKMPINIGEMVNLINTSVNMVIPIKTKDNKSINVQVKTEAQAKIELGVVAKDYESDLYSFSVESRQSNNLDSLIKGEIAIIERSKKNFEHIYGRKVEDLILIFVQPERLEKIVTSEGSTLYEAKELNSQIFTAKYNLKNKLLYEPKIFEK